MYSTAKCRKCRFVLTPDLQHESVFINSHGASLNKDNITECLVENVIFLDVDLLPGWILGLVDAEQWSKGRIHCPKCDSRLGAFNFVGSPMCECHKCVLPSVHLTTSKVELVLA